MMPRNGVFSYAWRFSKSEVFEIGFLYVAFRASDKQVWLLLLPAALWGCGQMRVVDRWMCLIPAEFADSARDAAGKLSFKERDVSFFFVFGNLQSCRCLFALYGYRTIIVCS
jgi:hypothetical protein